MSMQNVTERTGPLIGPPKTSAPPNPLRLATQMIPAPFTGEAAIRGPRQSVNGERPQGDRKIVPVEISAQELKAAFGWKSGAAFCFLDDRGPIRGSR